MKQYRGYYIDHITFNNEHEIDEFIKNQAIESYRRYCRMFAKNPTMELSAIMSDCMTTLHDKHGLTWDQIEEIELTA